MLDCNLKKKVAPVSPMPLLRKNKQDYSLSTIILFDFLLFSLIFIS